MKINSITDIGVSRKDNQDNYWSALLSVGGKEVGVLCVCDGMGGLENGRLASSMVVREVAKAVKGGSDLEEISRVLDKVNEEVYLEGKSRGKQMGTTCTLLECSEGVYKILHIGDSRCYRVRDGRLEKLTKDHSAIAEYGITREKDPELYKKYKNMLTRCIGVKESISVDYYEGEYSEGDLFFVCSDGLWHYFERNERRYLDGVLDDLEGLVKKCIGVGEKDNITCSVLAV